MTDLANLTPDQKIDILSLGCLKMMARLVALEERLEEVESAFDDHILDHDEGVFDDDSTLDEDNTALALIPHEDAMLAVQEHIDSIGGLDQDGVMEVSVDIPLDLDYEDQVVAFMSQMTDNVRTANADGFLSDQHAVILLAAFQGEFTDDFEEVINPPSDVQNMSVSNVETSEDTANLLFSVFMHLLQDNFPDAHSNYMLAMGQHLGLPQELLAQMALLIAMKNVYVDGDEED